MYMMLVTKSVFAAMPGVSSCPSRATLAATPSCLEQPSWHHQHLLAQVYGLTMDTTQEHCIYLHHQDRAAIRFTPTKNKGLYHYPLPDDQSPTDYLSLLQTVSSQAENYSNCTVAAAHQACCMQNIIM
jgi:hypothetical protein